MKSLPYIIFLIIMFYIGYSIRPSERLIFKTITTTDTFTIINTIFKDSIVTDTLIDSLYTIDSVLVPVYIPITQKHYSDSVFNKSDTAIIDSYVSGYKVSLDSTKVIFKNTTLVPVYKKDSKWSIGLSAGYGASKSGLSPIIGITVNYKLFEW